MELDLGKPFWNSKSKEPPLVCEIGNYSTESSILPEPTNCSYIYLCFDRNQGDKKVIKFIKFIKKSIPLIINEIETMKIAKHSNILNIIDYFRFEDYMCLVLPYTPNRSLLTLVINKYPEGIPENIASKLMKQMLSAVDYLHDLNIWHRDIKPSNFLIFYDKKIESTNENGLNDINGQSNSINEFSSNDINGRSNSNNECNSNDLINTNKSANSKELNNTIDSNNNDNNSNDLNGRSNSNNECNSNDVNTNIDALNEKNDCSEEEKDQSTNALPKVVLSDFGFAKIFTEGELSTEYLGSPYFMAPEIHNGQPYDKSVDIWALGISLFYMLTHLYPLPLPSSRLYGSRLSKGKLNFKILTKKKVSDEAISLIKKMCAFNPKDRITAKKALLDPWILTEVDRKTATEREVLNDIGLSEEYNSIQGV